MRVVDNFMVAGGSVRGTDHIRKGINNHDAMHVAYDVHTNTLVGVVCDGCGSGQDSEVGAKVGSMLVATSIFRHLTYSPLDEIWPGVRKEVCSHIHTLSLAMENGDAIKNVIATNFLFTIVGFVITEERTVVFHIGDGYYALCRDVVDDDDGFFEATFEPMEGNYPPYIAYNIVETHVPFLEKDLEFSVVWYPTKTVNGILVATDGIERMKVKQNLPVRPGAEESIGLPRQFLCEDRYVKNSHALQRKLARLNPYQPVIFPDWEQNTIHTHLGHLNDDTTVVMARKMVKNDE